MATSGMQRLTGILAAWAGGDADALDGLVTLLYPQLRQLARYGLARRRAGDTLDSVALTNEAYVRLVRAGSLHCDDRAHFLALCSQIMRRILVDHARRRRVAKRGGQIVLAAIDDEIVATEPRGVDLLALDAALEELRRIDPRKSRVVELRYFGGLSVEETADVIGVSVETTKRDWRMARAWLRGAITGDPSDRPPAAQHVGRGGRVG